jgi:hypothetical protein
VGYAWQVNLTQGLVGAVALNRATINLALAALDRELAAAPAGGAAGAAGGFAGVTAGGGRRGRVLIMHPYHVVREPALPPLPTLPTAPHTATSRRRGV